ncbi:hypothetical protein [Chondromyces crocatus]|uniref:Uncharacterized protein n=1 Tax=Chondromyces crocatus TaxID=52 RepID=A0A0K1EA90_CHOCO|nr:hypothetical protein [Chondromyces crocatus]AKT37577.1 uncharacterized protein CMC5_017180 [Chondromyces crocatus]
MPTRKFSLKSGEAKRVEVSWKGIWKDIRVRFDGQEIGGFESKSALDEGREFQLPDGLGHLRVQLVRSMGSVELQVLRNGSPLPGSDSDPNTKLKTAWGVILFVGGMSMLAGLVSTIGQVEAMQRLGLGIETVVLGVLFLGLGLWVRARRSKIALGIAFALLALDGVFSIVTSLETGGGVGGGIVLRLFILLGIFKGFSAISQLEAEGGEREGVAALSD